MKSEGDCVDLLTIFNYSILVIFLFLATFIVARMTIRVYRFLKFKLPVPTLLKRDVLFFGSFLFYVGSGILALALGFTNLAREPLWVIPRSLFAILATAYWAKVEYQLEDRIEKDK